MTFFLKCFFGVFVLTGVAFSVYALLQLWETYCFVKTSPGRAKATFVEYDQEWFKTTTSSPSPTNWGQQDFTESWSVMSYPVFSYETEDGRTLQIREAKAHVFEVLVTSRVLCQG